MVLMLVMLLTALLEQGGNLPPSPPPQPPKEARPVAPENAPTPSALEKTSLGFIEAISQDQRFARLRSLEPEEMPRGEPQRDQAGPLPGPTTFKVTDRGVQDRLKQFRQGDLVAATWSPGSVADPDPVLMSVKARAELTGGLGVAATLVGTFVSLWLLAGTLGAGRAPFPGAPVGVYLPLRFIIGEDNRYSSSKFQSAVWFLLLVTGYVSAFCLRVWFGGMSFIGGIDVPPNIALAAGISAISLAGAKAITVQKLASAPAFDAGASKPPGAAPALLRDLTHNDQGRPDFGDLQMVVITTIVIGAYLVQLWAFLGRVELRQVVSLPDIDTSLLAAFGIGQGAYLAKKAASEPGRG